MTQAMNTPTSSPPLVAVFDVNETLSDMKGLARRLEEIGAGADLLPAWFAATLRDGFALTAAGAYADFSAIAVPTLAARLAGVGPLAAPPTNAPSMSSRAWRSLIYIPMWPPDCTGSPTLVFASSR